MASPIDRSKLSLAEDNQQASKVASSQANIETIKVLYDYADTLNNQDASHATNPVLAHPDGSVTRAKLANGAVDSTKLADNSVVPSKIPNNSLTFDKFVPSALMNETQNALRITALQEDVAQRMINVRSFGAVGDGVTDDSESLVVAANEAIQTGGRLYFPAGAYYAPSFLSIIVDRPLWITGAGSEVVKIIGDGPVDADLFDVRSSVYIERITFEYCGNILNFANMTDAIESVIVWETTLRNCRILFTGLNYTNPNHAFKLVHVEECYIDGSAYQGIVMRANSLEKVNIIGNRIIGATHYGIRFGVNDEDIQNSLQHYTIRDNYIKDIITPGSLETMGILLYGRKAVVEGNYIENIASADLDGVSGIYTKCLYSHINNNVLIDGGRLSACINIKGTRRTTPSDGVPRGYDVHCKSNSIICTTDDASRGINIETDNVLCESNYIEGTKGEGIRILGTNSTRVINNTILNIRGTEGINCGGEDRTNLQVNGNIIDVVGSEDTAGQEHNGIRFANSGSSLRNIDVSHNIISNLTSVARGIHFHFSGGTSSNIVLTRNIIDSSNIGIQLTKVNTPTISYVTIEDNMLRGYGPNPMLITSSIDRTTFKIKRNSGYVTENKGTATITSANTSVVVNHGLKVTPAIQDISVTPTSDMGSSSKFWVSNPSDSQFTINVNTAPGTSITFGWKIDT